MADLAFDAMYLASVDALTATAQIGDGGDLAASEAVRQQMLHLLRQLVDNCRAAGIADGETAEARYAIVAFMDDRILKSSWPGRAEWQRNPLQLQLFREFTAGENFFARMRALIQRGESVFALEVYYCCLILGFGGAAAGGGRHSMQTYVDAARQRLLQGRRPDCIAPNAIPTERERGPQRRPLPIARATIVACVALCLCGLAGLNMGLDAILRQALDAVSAARQAHPSSEAR